MTKKLAHKCFMSDISSHMRIALNLPILLEFPSKKAHHDPLGVNQALGSHLFPPLCLTANILATHQIKRRKAPIPCVWIL